MAYNTPHSPFQVPDYLYEAYRSAGLSPKNASGYGIIDNIDHNYGRLLEHLDQLVVRENTIIIFLTDNSPNGDRYNAVLRGRKAQAYEAGTNVPFWISWPVCVN